MPKAGRSRSDINHSIYSKQREKIKRLLHVITGQPH